MSGVSKNLEITEGGVSLGLRITNEEALGGELERGGGVGPSTAFSGVTLAK